MGIRVENNNYPYFTINAVIFFDPRTEVNTTDLN